MSKNIKQKRMKDVCRIMQNPEASASELVQALVVNMPRIDENYERFFPRAAVSYKDALQMLTFVVHGLHQRHNGMSGMSAAEILEYALDLDLLIELHEEVSEGVGTYAEGAPRAYWLLGKLQQPGLVDKLPKHHRICMVALEPVFSILRDVQDVQMRDVPARYASMPRLGDRPSLS